MQCEACTSAHKNGFAGQLIHVSVWKGRLCYRSWELHWCQCQLSQVLRFEMAWITLQLCDFLSLLTYFRYSDLRKFSRQAAEQTMDIFSHSTSVTTGQAQGFIIGRITKMDYSLYRQVLWDGCILKHFQGFRNSLFYLINISIPWQG